MTDLVTSLANPVVKRFRLLADRKHRRREGAFIVEGLQPVWRAVASEWPIEVLIVAPDLLINSAAADMVDNEQRSGTRVVRVSREVFLRISDRDGPNGLAAIVSGGGRELDTLVPSAGAPVVALHRVANPGNIGTIVRTADAAGASGVVLIGNTADPFAPTSIKASMGSVFSVPVVQTASVDAFFAWADRFGQSVVAATGAAIHELWDVDYTASTVVLLGSEGDGLPDDVVVRCALGVRIPMVGSAESLNLATAASIMLYELRRRSRPDTDGSLP